MADVNRSDEDPVFAARPRNVQHYRAAREPDSFAPGVTGEPADLVEAVARAIEGAFTPPSLNLWSWQEWRGEAEAAIAAVRACDARQLCPCDVARRSGACCRETIL